MNDKTPKSETKCTACGKEWYHAETFIIVSVNCKGYVEDGKYVDDDALFGERELAALCEDCPGEEVSEEEEEEEEEEAPYCHWISNACAGSCKKPTAP